MSETGFLLFLCEFHSLLTVNCVTHWNGLGWLFGIGAT